MIGVRVSEAATVVSPLGAALASMTQSVSSSLPDLQTFLLIALVSMLPDAVIVHAVHNCPRGNVFERAEGFRQFCMFHTVLLVKQIFNRFGLYISKSCNDPNKNSEMFRKPIKILKHIKINQ